MHIWSSSPLVNARTCLCVWAVILIVHCQWKQSARTFLYVQCVHIPRDRKLTCFEKSSAGTFNFYWRLVASGPVWPPRPWHWPAPGTWPALGLWWAGHWSPDLGQGPAGVKTRTQGQHPCWLGPALSVSVSLALPSKSAQIKYWKSVSCSWVHVCSSIIKVPSQKHSNLEFENKKRFDERKCLKLVTNELLNQEQ